MKYFCRLFKLTLIVRKRRDLTVCNVIFHDKFYFFLRGTVITSIIVWRNYEEGDNIWAVSDSRVSSTSGGVMTDNCPKLFSIAVKAYLKGDFLIKVPNELFSFGFGFAGSTLIGSNVKEMLTVFVGNLGEINFYDNPDFPFDEKIPSLYEIANLTKTIMERYILSMGILFPLNARSEIVVFGFCLKSKKYQAFKICNTPEDPAQIIIIESEISNGQYLVLGDQVKNVSSLINSTRANFELNTINWHRAPFIALANILRNERVGTIGGYLQFCIVNSIGARLFYISSPKESEEVSCNFVGFDIFRDIGMLGGFSLNFMAGITMPSENGWHAIKKLN